MSLQLYVREHQRAFERTIREISRLETRNPCNMEPYDDAMSAACAALQRMIESSLDMPIEDQPTLDRLLAAHQYHFGDISDWPNDICEILPGEMMSLEPPEIYFLGSLAACRHLRTHQETVPLSYRKVSVVLSVCPREMKRIRGQPEVGWKAWFEDLQIRWFTFDVDDPRTYLDDTNTFCQEVGNAWLSSWMDMCCALLKHLKATTQREERGILFHCFGGVNRSSAALCAWLIFRRQLSAEAAVQSLLTARPTPHPWKHRPHVFWALRTWEKNLNSFVRPRIFAALQEL